MRRPHRILLIAEAANPEWTSVPLIGWSLSRALAKVADCHLVTHVRNRDAIIRAGLTEGRDFTAIDNEQIASPLFKLSDMLRGGEGKGWTTITAFSSLAYYSFELAVWRQFSARIIAREFDLVHRITPLSPTSQSIIAKRLARLRNTLRRRPPERRRAVAQKLHRPAACGTRLAVLRQMAVQADAGV